jgi:hypothetical protein
LKERLLSTKRVSARHQVNGRIVVSKRAFCSKTGPAEETGFLRSVRILQVRNFSGLKGRLASSLPASSLRLPGTRLKSDPDVFADALVPVTAPLAPVFDFPKFISDRPLTWTRRFDTRDRVKQPDRYLAPMPADSRGIRGHGNFPSVAGAFGMPDYRDSACHRAGVAPDRPKDDHP